MNRKAVRKQRGFALIGALFVLVVLAALGAFAVRSSHQCDAAARCRP